MRIPFALVTVLVLLGTATLFAGPEEKDDFTLGLAESFGVDEATAGVLEKALGEASPWKVRLDATFLRIDAAQAGELLKEHQPDPMGSARPVPSGLGRRLVDAARGAGPVRTDPLPPLVLFDGQRGRLSSTGRHTYAQDFDVEVGLVETAPTLLVGQMQDGAVLDVTPRRDVKRMRLAVGATWAQVVRPVPRFETDLVGRQVTIQLPEMLLFQVRKTVELPAAGGFVLAGVGRAWDDGSLRVVVIEARAAKR